MGKNYFTHEFVYTGIKTFNYVEFLFNSKTDYDFIFDGNTSIKREISKAILKKDNIPYLAPELVLLYKSEKLQRKDYDRIKKHQMDYDETISKMNTEQIYWFNNSLDILYPNGHAWRK